MVIEWRAAEAKRGCLLELATELVRLKVDVIVVTGVGDLRSAKEATATIPIVMVVDSDPVGSGFVANLAEDLQMLAGCQMFQGHGHRHEQQQQADNLHRTPIACVTRCRVCASLG